VPSTLESLASLVGTALRPLSIALDGPDERLSALVALLGWSLPGAPPTALRDLRAHGTAVVGAITRLELVTSLEREGLGASVDVAAAAAEVVGAMAALGVDLNHLEARLTAQLPASFVAKTDLPAAFTRRLLDFCLIGLLASYAPVARAAGSALGLIEETAMQADVGRYQPAYTLRRVRWDRVPALLDEPGTVLRELYGWGTASIDPAALLSRIDALATRLVAVPIHSRAEPALVRALAPAATTRPVHTRFPILASEALTIWLGVMPVPATDTLEAAGIAVTVQVEGVIDQALDLSPSLSLDLHGTLDLGAGVAIVIRPGRDPVLVASAFGTAPASVTDGNVSFALVRLADEARPRVLLDIGDGSELQVGTVSLLVEADAAPTGGTLSGELALEAARLVVRPRDGFISTLLPPDGIAVDFDLAVGWSPTAGVYLVGGTGLELSLPLGLSILDLVILDALHVSIAADATGVAVSVATSLSLTLGPIVAAVDRIGISATLAVPAGGGNLGPADCQLGFLPPTGLGIGVDVEGVISGGGFLRFAADVGRYDGTAALQMLGVGLTVMGIVQTQLPGDPGWSLFLSVIADFTPVPLGFGFTLNGVGGFMGLHRTLDELALAEGVREGRLDSLLFPEDPVGEATRILADIEAYFPTLAEHHAFGAMAKLGWGTPTLITAELGVIVAVPELEIAVVGEVAAVLPRTDLPLLELHMGVVGFIDVAEATFWIAASIYDSQLVGLTLSGDMAMYLTLGAEPYFLLSVGGFHPAWSAPPSVPSTLRRLRRMAASIDLGESLELGVESYFAVTSNTLQFGAEAFAVARAREVGIDFTAEGWFGFDVLLTLAPFTLRADMSAGVAVRAEGETLAGIQLDLHLEGPEPWYGTGRADFTFLVWDVPFRVEVGRRPATESPETIELWPVLEAAVADPASWMAPSTAEAVPEVSLRALDPVLEPGLWLRPDGAIELRQHVLPLGREIDTYGALDPIGQTRFDVEAAGLATGIEADGTAVQDWFASAQFITMRAADRLSAPSFELMDAGVSLTSRAVTVTTRAADVASVEVAYEEAVMVDRGVERKRVRRLRADRLGLGLRRPRVLGRPGSRRTVEGPAFSVGSTRYAVVDPLRARTIDPSPGRPASAPGGGGGQTFAEAVRLRQALDGEHPALRGRLRVVPAHDAIQSRDLPSPGRHDSTLVPSPVAPDSRLASGGPES
jgi:hypothetical protein